MGGVVVVVVVVVVVKVPERVRKERGYRTREIIRRKEKRASPL